VSRLVVASNRVPSPDGEPAAGGLAVALRAALREAGGLWFGWSGEISKETSETRLRDQDGISYATVDLSAVNYQGYYEGYANQTLWPLFHYRVDLTVFDRGVFEHYRLVNELFAERLAPLLKADDLVWIHDYHLIPLGEELRRRGCRQRVGFFLHTPFPAPEILVTLFNHRRLVRSLLAYDLVGFQTPEDLRSFRDYVVQELRDGRVEGDSVSAYGQHARAEAFPIGIDPEAFRELTASPSAKRYRDRMQKSLGGSDLILSVDRLDYSKGLPQRMAAVEMLFERYGDLRGRVSFLQIASPSREDVPEYQAIRQELEGAVGHINGRFADSEWAPVRYVSKTYSQSRLCGLYPLAKVGLVTPLRDGMNLVAKEYVAAQTPHDPGVLVLSRFAGAAHQMEVALIVNPYDKLEVSEAIKRGLDMPREERAERWTTLMQGLERDNLDTWRNAFVTALQAVDRPGS
jgi:trehalose 6-phosphate synthase